MFNKFKAQLNEGTAALNAAFVDISRSTNSTMAELTSSFSIADECTRSKETLASFLAAPSVPGSALNSIPLPVLKKARGIAVFRIAKVGFMFSGKVGSGLVIARVEDGSWSAPSLIATGGLGWGIQLGAELTEVVCVLNSDEAVKAFAQGGNVTIGGQISASVGPIGTGAALQSALMNPAPVFTYTKSQGLFAGLSLEGTVLITRDDANAAFYGSAIPARDILSGKVPPPQVAGALYDIIESAEGLNEPAYAPHVPSTEGPQASQPSQAHQGPEIHVQKPSASVPQEKSDILFDSTQHTS